MNTNQQNEGQTIQVRTGMKKNVTKTRALLAAGAVTLLALGAPAGTALASQDHHYTIPEWRPTQGSAEAGRVLAREPRAGFPLHHGALGYGVY